jgi:hypothetical protein
MIPALRAPKATAASSCNGYAASSFRANPYAPHGLSIWIDVLSSHGSPAIFPGQSSLEFLRMAGDPFLCTGNSAACRRPRPWRWRARRAGAGRQRGKPPQAGARQHRARDAGTGHRRGLTPLQAPEPVRWAAVRLRDHAMRQAPRGLAGVPGPPRLPPLERPRPGRSRNHDEATLPAFRQTADDVETRVTYLLAGLGALPGWGPP